MIKLMLVDDYPVYRQGLAGLIMKDSSEYAVVAETGSEADLLKTVGEYRPDVVILDQHLQYADTDEITGIIRDRFSDVKVIIMSGSDREEDLFRAIRAGASAYLLKSMTFKELMTCLHTVVTGDAALSAPMLSKLVDEFRRKMKDTGSDLYDLSAREIEILSLAARGYSNKKIAAECFISETTVKAHFRSILSKMEVGNRAGAVAIATARGFIRKELVLSQSRV